ncbi:PTS sugar transporter subunit IIA, partial [Lactobacillus apis]
HAIGLRSPKGAEVMIHIGMDTVELDGEGFKLLTEKGKTVKAGEPLIEFDIDKIKKAGYEVTTPIIVTNTNNYHKVNVVASGDVTVGDKLLDLE